MVHITLIKYKNFKSFQKFTIILNKFNVLVGPNNSGKSTIIGSLKILAEGIRKAKSKKPTTVKGADGINTLGYTIDLSHVPVATENVFYNYDDSEPATITFNLSSNNSLKIVFHEPGTCYMICETSEGIIHRPAEFNLHFNIDIGYVPVLGPVEYKEREFQKEAARQALLSYTASRNFRNIWHHYPENFEEFRNLVKDTWPGMDIERPEIDRSGEHPILNMFCPEDRIPREIFWAGFGFQVWCQMLTYIIKNKNASIFLIDEPDIYLHSDLQRQLIGILKFLGPDILIATHSTEMISESDINEVLVINKSQRTAKRIKNLSQLQDIFNTLGSNLNPTLTQIAKTKRVIFVEGRDFSIIAKIARKLGSERVATRSSFAVVPVEGFNPQRLRAFKQGIESTIGSRIVSAVIFDRDYRCDDEVSDELSHLQEDNLLAHIHNSKELENYLLLPTAINKAIHSKISDIESRSGRQIAFSEDVSHLLDMISSDLKHKILAQLQARQFDYLRKRNPEIDKSNITEEILDKFESSWSSIEKRLTILPGKEILSRLNEYLQTNYKFTISISEIINNAEESEIDKDFKELIKRMEGFSKARTTN